SAADAEQDKSASRKQKDVEDARAELTNSPPAEAPQPTPSVAQVKVVKVVRVADAAPVPATDAAAQVPPAPVLPRPGTDQLTAEQLLARHVNVETLLADTAAASDQVVSRQPATPVAARGAETDGGGGWTTNWLGMLLMAVGIVALLSASLGASRT